MLDDTKVLLKASTSRRLANSRIRKADQELPKVELKSSEGQVFKVEISVACQSRFIKDMVEDMGSKATASPIVFPNISSKILAKVMEYCTYHERSQRSSNGSQKVSKDVERIQ